jgi:uncharacterized caspase-like protein
MTFHKKFMAAATLLALGALAASPVWAQATNPRIALVIGDAAYPDHPLATTANDAGLVAQTLQAAGFDVVGAADLDQNALRGALRDFLDKAAAIGPDMQAVVYLAGRGVQYDGDNYFIPVDAHIARDTDIPIQAVKISDFSHALAATPGRARIIVMDAARATALAREGSSVAGGLGLVDPEEGTLIAFNAAPGTVAPDESGPYGAYGKSLAGAMRAPGMPIGDVFAQVRLQVNQQTNGAVVPWSASKVQEPYSIFERAPDAPPPPAAAAAIADIASRPIKSFKADEAYSVAMERDTLEGYQEFLAAYPHSPQARRVRAILAARREAIFWRRAVNENSPRAYWTYLRVYSRGPHVGDARRRLAILSAEFAPPPDFAPEEYADAPPPPPDEYVYVRGPVFIFDDPDYGPPPPPPPIYFVPEEDDDWRDLPPPRQPEGIGFLPVLPLAIPLIIGAKMFHKDKSAPQAPPPAPPPLPPSFKPTPTAATPGAPAPAGPTGKPLPGAPAAAPSTQPLNAAKPLPVVPGAPAAVSPTQPQNAAKPLPGAPAAVSPTQPQNAAKPLPGAPAAVSPTQPQNAAKPLPGAPAAVSPAQPQNAAKPLPGATPGAKLPTPAEPAVVKPVEPATAPKAPKPAPVEPKPAPIKAAPVVEPKPQLQILRPAPAPAPVVHAAPPPPPPPQPKAPPPPPPVVHAAPPPPVVHAAPPPPVVHAAPPPPPPVVHVAPPPPPPPPAAAKPPPGKAPPCGAPGQAPCPK